jgi:hypothetical protein
MNEISRNSLVEERLLNEARVEIRQLKAEIEQLKAEKLELAKHAEGCVRVAAEALAKIERLEKLIGPLRMETLR